MEFAKSSFDTLIISNEFSVSEIKEYLFNCEFKIQNILRPLQYDQELGSEIVATR